jgi:PKD repeat protein
LAEKCVVILEQPDAQLTTIPAAKNDTVFVCTGQTVYFQNKSQGANATEWTFEDDGTATYQNDPAHVFKTPGLFKARLIARSNCLCVDTTEVFVRVAAAAGPTLDCVGTICAGATVTYTASGGCPPFQWGTSPNGAIVAGGTAAADSITVRWNDGPEGFVRLGAVTCSGAQCNTLAEVRVPVLDDKAKIRGKNRVCRAAAEDYQIETYGGTGYVWKLSGGGVIKEGQGTSQVSIQWQDDPTWYYRDLWLTVEYDNCYLGCKGQDSLLVRIVPGFFIEAPFEACAGTAAFGAGVDITARPLCNWSLQAPDGSTTWTGPTPAFSVNQVPFNKGGGIYRLTATAADPTRVCNVSDDHLIQVTAQPPKPASIDGPAVICPSVPYTYQTLPGASGYNTEWTFWQDGNSASDQGNPVVRTWAGAVRRIVSVQNVTTDGLGCKSDTLQLKVEELLAPVISGPPAVCRNQKGSYQIMPQENADIQWKILPATAGAVSKGQGSSAIEIFWTQPGTHTIEVSVCSKKSTFAVTVHTLPTPVAQHIAGVCEGQTAPVTTSLSYSAYIWATETGAVVSTQNQPQLSAGTYALTVRDANGCVSATQFTIKEYPVPNVTATTADPTGFCNNSRNVTITALTEKDGEFKYNWFRDQLPWGGNDSKLTTNQYGLYSVQVTNQYGCTASDGDVRVFEYCAGVCHDPSNPPLCQPGDLAFNILPTAYCDSFDFQLRPGPLYAPGNVSWYFGKSGGKVLGSTQAENPAFKFPNAGKYIVFAYAKLTNGATCLVLDSVDVAAAAQFDTIVKCAGTTSTFLDESTFLPGGGIQNWAWEFGDPASGPNNTATGPTPFHNFSLGGTYRISLTVTAQNGCLSKAWANMKVPEGSLAIYVPPAARCSNNALSFEAPVLPGVTKTDWNFGDPASNPNNTAEGWEVAHTYKNSGNYQVLLTTTNAYGCTAVYTDNITVVNNTLTGNISPGTPPAVCAGQSVTLSAPNGGVTWLWSDRTTTTRQLTAVKEGVYKVTLTDQNGCVYVPPAVSVQVHPAPNVHIQSLWTDEAGTVTGTQTQNAVLCQGEELRLRAVADVFVNNYTWSNGSIGAHISFTKDRNNVLSVGTYTYAVTIRDSRGCTAVSSPYAVVVNPVPAPFYINANSQCAGTPAIIRYNGPAPASDDRLIWNTGQEGRELTTSEAGRYTLRVVNRFGCATRSYEWNMLPGPNVQAIPSGCHRRCRPDTLCLPAVPGIVSWQWFYNGTAISGAVTPQLIAPVSGTYWAQLKDIYGCNAQTGALTLDLYEGFGDIHAKVWADVNKNGQIDAADTLVSGIALELLLNNTLKSTSLTNAGGQTVFAGVGEGQYVVQLGTLPPQWKPVIPTAGPEIQGCAVKKETAFLITKECIPATGTLTLPVCPGGTVQYQTVTLQAGETRDFVFKNSEGCDSTLRVHALPRTVGTGNLQVRVCPGGTFLYQGTPVWAGETRVFVVPTAQGCDSTVQVRVLARPIGTDTIRAQVCSGETFRYQNTDLRPGQIRDFTIQTADGCDSVVQVQVTAYSVPTSTLEVAVCAGTGFSYFGREVPAGTSQTFLLSSWRGCDSLVTVKVSEKPAATGTLQVQICPDGTYNFQNTVLTPGQTERFTLKTPNGCDSILTISVMPLPRNTAALHQKVCPGETFTYYGVEMHPGEVQVFDLTSWKGCDSLVSVSVEAYTAVPPVVQEETVCPGATFLWQGKTLRAGDSATAMLTNWRGCDSLVTLRLKAWPATTFEVQAMPSCAGQPTGSLWIRSLQGGTGTHRFSLDGTRFASESAFTQLAAGPYTLWTEDEKGCRARRDTTLTARERLTVLAPPVSLDCDSADVALRTEIQGDTTQLRYLWWNGSTAPVARASAAGQWRVEVSNVCEKVQKDVSVSWLADSDFPDLVYLPNAFMPVPSREARNALFLPAFRADTRPTDYRLEVYDRWGSLVFRSEDPAAGWDGRTAARHTGPEVFVWHLQAKVAFCGREVMVRKKGDVVVVE